MKKHFCWTTSLPPEIQVDVFRFLNRREISGMELLNSRILALVEAHLAEKPHLLIDYIPIHISMGGVDQMAIVGCKIQFLLGITKSELSDPVEIFEFFKAKYLCGKDVIIFVNDATNPPVFSNREEISFYHFLGLAKHLWHGTNFEILIDNWGTTSYELVNEFAVGCKTYRCWLRQMPSTFSIMQIKADSLSIQGKFDEYPIETLYAWLLQPKIPTKYKYGSLDFQDKITHQDVPHIKKLLEFIEKDFGKQRRQNIQFVVWMSLDDDVSPQLIPDSFVAENAVNQDEILRHSNEKGLITICRYHKNNAESVLKSQGLI